jgi:regulator of sirC expression with transglutaminase-like and TPR domain
VTKADAISLFEDLVRRDDSAIRLPAAALAITRVAYPSLVLGPYLGILSDMGKVAAHRVSAVTAADDRVARLNHYVFGELGFQGNRKSYYDPRNSFLNDVLERRLGIPITLALVYIEIAAACRMHVEGIGFPGHFLVRDVATGWILDPYNGGQRREIADCKDLFVEQGFEAKDWSEDLLAPVSKRQFLLRMINNLRRHYSDAGDAVRLAMLEAMASAVAGAGEPGPMPMLH